MKKATLYVIIMVVIISVGAICYILIFQNTVKDKTIPRKAAIIDNLALTNPNPSFVEEVKSILRKANFSDEDINYYGYENVTVNFYQKLPKLGYGLILLRVHSSMLVDSDEVCLYTSELITKSALTHYVDDMGYKLVNSTLPQTGKHYFGIPPDFVRPNMEGQFKNTVIIAMGCNSCRTETMAKALVGKGVKLYIGWDKDVLPSHTDTQTIRLLEMLFLKNKTIADAVENTEPDRIMHGSRLRYYPSDLGNLQLSTFIENLSFLRNRILDIHLLTWMCLNPKRNLTKHDQNSLYFNLFFRIMSAHTPTTTTIANTMYTV
jgi:hypothetical protein